MKKLALSLALIACSSSTNVEPPAPAALDDTGTSSDTAAPAVDSNTVVLKVDEVPVLGSGKVDYVAIQQMADTQGEAAA